LTGRLWVKSHGRSRLRESQLVFGMGDESLKNSLHFGFVRVLKARFPSLVAQYQSAQEVPRH